MKRNEIIRRYVAMFLLLNIVFEVVSPSLALALTSGPHQPELQQFEPAGSSEMVDLFTGDFKYNIPLLDVEGYPINLSYHAGQEMDKEASWVGLGWSLNPGVMNRMVKGLPDDFKGDVTETEVRIKPNVSMGVGYQRSSWFGTSMNFANIGVSQQIGASGAVVLSYNNYKGFGLELEMDGNASLTRNLGLLSFNAGGGVGMSLSSQDGGTLRYNYQRGVGVNFGFGNVGLSANYTKGEATSINTRSGSVFKTYSTTYSAGLKVEKVSVGIGYTSSHTMPVGAISYSPRNVFDYRTQGFGASLKAGLWGRLGGAIGLPIPGMNIPLPTLTAGVMRGFKGFYNKSRLLTTAKNSPSYGYLYEQNQNHLGNTLHDFNRFRDGMMMQETPNSSMASRTYDVFSAAAQGMGSNFRAFRSDIGTVSDPEGTLSATNTYVGTELGVGILLHLLLNTNITLSSGKSQQWQGGVNTTLNHLNYDLTTSTQRFRQPTYFKEMGEIIGRDAAYDGSIGGEAPVSPVLHAVGVDYQALSPIAGTGRLNRDRRSKYIESLTAKQASEYGFDKTISEYNSGFLFDVTKRMMQPSLTRSRTSITVPGSSTGYLVDHHLSEFSVTNPSGDRYVYGIPVYNLEKTKVSFNASDRQNSTYQANGWPTFNFTNNPLPKSNGNLTVKYDPSADLNTNLRGNDNFYQKEKTPPFAISYLLTNIVSQDYVDITGNGVSYDDLGQWTKFNYRRYNEYGWREPYGTPFNDPNMGNSGPAEQANFEPGLLSDKLDDRAFYEYGIRENYYVQSIETKNYVVVFETSDKDDGMGVMDQHQQAQPSSSQRHTLKLDRIKLYSKNEIIEKGGFASAVPVKTVHFKYNYSLCPGVFNHANPSSMNGKLTLEKIYFTTENSLKGALSPYEFYYADTDHNPATGTGGMETNFPYDPRSIDRWGSYSPNSGGQLSGALSGLNTSEFPYAIQNKAAADLYAAAWNLTRIVTPSGAQIKINYEADDYGYVQNEQAGQMLMVYNYVNSINPAAAPPAPSGNDITDIKEADYMIVDLSRFHRGIPVSGNINADNNFLKRNVFKLNKKLFFKCFTKLAGPECSFGLKEDYYDFIPGYANLDAAGLFSGGTYTDGTGTTCYKYAYLKLRKEIAYDSKEVSPVSFAGWDFLRHYLPRVAYPGSEPANMGNTSHKPLKQFTNMIIGLGIALADMVNGMSGDPNKRFYRKNFCNTIKADKSFIRAYVPYKQKLGGGHRVKQIISSDNWGAATGGNEETTTYGQRFEYTTTEGNSTISSGVALYEPIMGGDEISLRQPVSFEIEKKMAPNDHYFQEMPLGEMLYPAPSVGYSKVSVKVIPNPEQEAAFPNPANIGKIGRIEYGFYTAKDFPIEYRSTGLSKRMTENDLLEDFIIVKKALKIMNTSQGYALKFNDMHGKLRSVANYGEDNPAVAISGMNYYYRSTGSANGSRNLITTAPAINESNQISTAVMARDIDVTVDAQENITESVTNGFSFLLEIGITVYLIPNVVPPFIPPVIPFPLPDVNIDNDVIYGEQRLGVRNATITKVVQQYGILEKVETFDNKAKTTTENLLWDINTGNVVLTKTTNHLDQSVYEFNYPAYWAYPQLGSEFKRDGIVFKCLASQAASVWDVSTGVLKKSAVDTPLLFAPGDEVMIRDAAGNPVGGRYWIQPEHNLWMVSDYVLVDENGVAQKASTNAGLSTSSDYMLCMVRPNNKNRLNESIGSVQSLTDPRVGSAIDYTGANQKIINASAVDFCSGSCLFINDHLTSQQQIAIPYNFISSGTVHNPYITGQFNNPQPTTAFHYNGTRGYGSQPNIKSDGTYSSFVPYWTYNSAQGKWKVNAGVQDWQKTGSNTYFSPFGQLVQSNNAINIPACERYGYNNTLPVLKAANAEADEVLFESFEDLNYSYGALGNVNTISVYAANWSGFYGVVGGAGQAALNTSVSHTGKYCLYFPTSSQVTVRHAVGRTYYTPAYGDVSACIPKLLDMSKMNLKEGKKYTASLWIKGVNSALTYVNQLNLAVAVKKISGSTTTNVTSISPTLVKSSGIINGWQKLDYEFTAPVLSNNSNDHVADIQISTTSGSTFYVDDFRIQPFQSSMECYVYDPVQLRLWASLDDRNYATILEYDQSGALVRKKKETEQSVMTIQETRSSLPKR